MDVKSHTSASIDMDNTNIAVCHANINGDSIEITGWSTNAGYRRQGYGKTVMRLVLQRFLKDRMDRIDEVKVTYVWNGQNAYVKDWLESMRSRCLADPAAVKYDFSDNPDNHRYEIPVKNLMAAVGIPYVVTK